MAKQVIKGDGSKAAFDPKKISKSISAAASDANMPPADINKITADVSGIVIEFCNTKDKLTTREIKEKTLMELDKWAPAAAAAWRRYDEKKGK